MTQYSAAVLEHFRNPRGPGRLPAGAPGTVSGEARHDDGGQRVRLHLCVDGAGRITRARFQAFGCPIAIAVASAAVARIEGASVEAALRLGADEIAIELALLPEQLPLAELPLAALRRALAYLRAP